MFKILHYIYSYTYIHILINNDTDGEDSGHPGEVIWRQLDFHLPWLNFQNGIDGFLQNTSKHVCLCVCLNASQKLQL